MKTITVTLPLPPRGLNPNAHVINYRQRARLIKKQRTEAGELAFAASGGKRLGWEKAAAQATFYFGTKRRRDTDNFNSSLKGAYDGLADAGLEELRKSVDAIIIIPNDRLLSVIDKDTSARNAFGMCDEVLKQAVEGISNLITTPGVINIDFADIKAVLENGGSALMGIGVASGDNRATEAARNAINSPLLDLSIHGAKGVLFSIAGGDDLKMFEIQEAAKVITESIDPDAKVIFGTIHDEKLKKNEIRVTVIASGFPENMPHKTNFQAMQSAPAVAVSGVTTASAPAHAAAPAEERRKFPAPTQAPAPVVMKEMRSEERGKPEAQAPSPVPEDNDDWGAVPAFLRRSKIK